MGESRLGNWLEWQTAKTGVWLKILYAVLGVLAVWGVIKESHAPHFVYDTRYIFWAGFGWVFAVVMTIVLKKIVFPILGKSEDFYGDDK